MAQFITDYTAAGITMWAGLDISWDVSGACMMMNREQIAGWIQAQYNACI